MLETCTAFIENDLYDVWSLLEQKAYQEAYRRYAPIWEDMLFICEEAAFLDFLEQQGPELEERPLRLHLAAWEKVCLEIGCYEGDVTEKLLHFLREDLPEKLLDRFEPSPVNVNIDELNGELDPQLKPWREQLEPWGCRLKVFFDDTYCAGVYFLFLEAPREW
ncbi:MAG: hypothetical protein HFG00_07990 [Oscillibacter sp.]|nr:hypothetical protein [Oscillibacter sp.]